ncbi:MAG: DUF2799 domain-containing protein [Gammaproteobacteria bacterium]
MPLKTLHRGAFIALALIALAGCASISEDECRAIDWRTVGYEDGATGQGVERLSSRRQACARHGVVPDLDAYPDSDSSVYRFSAVSRRSAVYSND